MTDSNDNRAFGVDNLLNCDHLNTGKDSVYLGIAANASLEIYTPPERSEWQCWPFGKENKLMLWQPLKGRHPNWFWRKMQYLCFGVEWEKVS